MLDWLAGRVQHRFKRTMRGKHEVSSGERAADGLRPIAAVLPRSLIDRLALGVEALDRFVRREPAFRVHECVFGVLALESEPVDPRL